MSEPQIRRSIQAGHRPQLTSIVEPRLRRLIQRCWEENDRRPSSSKIIRKIDKIAKDGVFCSVTVADGTGEEEGEVREVVLPCPYNELESLQFVTRLKGLARPKTGEGGIDEEGITLLVDGEDVDESLFEMLHEIVKPHSLVCVRPT